MNSSADTSRLEQQIRFIVEIDKLKGVVRRTLLIDRSRLENTAEHCWHIALMAALLSEHSRTKVDVLKVIKMLLVHDVVEIDAGDTYCYDPAANAGKADREQAAAARVFGLLPGEQAAEFRALWEEFEAGATPEAQFANAMDRLQPLLNNSHTQGESWRSHGVTRAQVSKRMEPIAVASDVLGQYAGELVSEAARLGYIAA